MLQIPLTRKLTIYQHTAMNGVLSAVRQLSYDDALENGALWLEYNYLANGYPFYALFVTDVLFGIVDIRGDVMPVQRALAAYLYRFGMRANGITFHQGAARMPQEAPTARCIDGEWVTDVWKPRDLPMLW